MSRDVNDGDDVVLARDDVDFLDLVHPPQSVRNLGFLSKRGREIDEGSDVPFHLILWMIVGHYAGQLLRERLANKDSLLHFFLCQVTIYEIEAILVALLRTDVNMAFVKVPV